MACDACHGYGIVHQFTDNNFNYVGKDIPCDKCGGDGMTESDREYFKMKQQGDKYLATGNINIFKGGIKHGK
jgi:DnaJ-class molecular chaperone